MRPTGLCFAAKVGASAQEKEDNAIFRFLARIRPQGNGCWIYTGSTSPETGHGQGWDGQRTTSAHRLSWLLFVGPITDGLYVLHAECCSSPACVNPGHLRLGTHLENMQDRWAWGAKWSRQEERRRGRVA